MKIFLFHFFSPNPTPDYSIFYNYFSEKKHEVLLSNMTLDGKLSIERKTGITFFDIFPWQLRTAKPFNFILKRFAFLNFIFRLRKIIKREIPDVFMIAPCELMYVGWLPLLMPRRIKFVYDLRQLGLSPGHTIKPQLNNIRAKFSIRFLTRFVFDHTCFAYKDAAVHVLGEKFKDKKSSIMEVGVDSLFIEIAKTKNAHLGKKLQLIYTGSLARVRKLEFIFQAIRSLKKTTKDFHVTFVGHDEDNYYHKLLETENLKDLVTILDPVPYMEVPALLNNYDVALAYVPEHPDWRFQPTLKVREYLACGIPVIATDNAPNRNFVKQNVNGFLIENKVGEFSNAVKKLINDPTLLKNITASAAQMRTGYTWRESGADYESLFEELIKKNN